MTSPLSSDLLFYEGLHGAAVTAKADVAKHADLLVGVVPIINLEWIQKLHRDNVQPAATPAKTWSTRFCGACRTTSTTSARSSSART